MIDILATFLVRVEAARVEQASVRVVLGRRTPREPARMTVMRNRLHSSHEIEVSQVAAAVAV